MAVCVCGGTPPTLDDSLKAMHGCFMRCFSVCKEPCLPPRFRFTTGRDGLGIFSVGTKGMKACRRLQRDIRGKEWTFRRIFKEEKVCFKIAWIKEKKSNHRLYLF